MLFMLISISPHWPSEKVLLPPFTLEKAKADTDWELAQGHAAGEAGVGVLTQIRGF